MHQLKNGKPIPPKWSSFKIEDFLSWAWNVLSPSVHNIIHKKNPTQFNRRQEAITVFINK
jgi:hypothetical protein